YLPVARQLRKRCKQSISIRRISLQAKFLAKLATLRSPEDRSSTVRAASQRFLHHLRSGHHHGVKALAAQTQATSSRLISPALRSMSRSELDLTLPRLQTRSVRSRTHKRDCNARCGREWWDTTSAGSKSPTRATF